MKGKAYGAGVLISVCAVVLLSALFLWNDNAVKPRANIVAYINNEPIDKEEFLLLAQQQRGYREEKDGKLSGSLKKRVMESLIQIKTAQQEAVRQGISEKSAYDSLTLELEQENKRRAEAVRSKQVIYGPRQFTLQSYYDYKHASTLNQLRTVWKKGQSNGEEEALRTYYMENRDQLARKHDIFRIFKLTEPSMDKEGNLGDQERREANGRIEVLLEQLKGGIPFMKLYESRKDKPGWTGIEVIGEGNYRDMAKYRSGFYELAAGLRPGESGIAEENGVMSIIYCDTRTEGGYLSFEEVREEVMLQYEDKAFGEYLERLASEAEVRLTGLYGTMKAE
ncbi:peptidylprolyl isomerase [Paenibacillus sp. SAF-054]|uniref:peptidylprolyl isomerase n=1 Tax=unclassified Paenibacillus TaxID=185978 RepID=UPI003F7ED6AC